MALWLKALDSLSEVLGFNSQYLYTNSKLSIASISGSHFFSPQDYSFTWAHKVTQAHK